MIDEILGPRNNLHRFVVQVGCSMNTGEGMSSVSVEMKIPLALCNSEPSSLLHSKRMKQRIHAPFSNKEKPCFFKENPCPTTACENDDLSGSS